MSPRPVRSPREPELSRLRAAGALRKRADADLRVAVASAARAGGSVREIARAAQLSSATVRAWLQTSKDSP